MELTQMLPVSIPRDSLRVSGLKDIQEHSAEGIKNTVMTVSARTVLGKSIIVPLKKIPAIVIRILLKSIPEILEWTCC